MTAYLRKGRFEEDASALFHRFGSSVSVDKRLYNEDIEGSIVHAKMLADRGIITEGESQAIVEGLYEIKTLIESGEFDFRIDLEDIHMNIEYALTEIIGSDISGKLHTARSRNDQVATDIRMWTRKEVKKICAAIGELQSVILSLAEVHHDTVMPGFTHMQVAQPITFGHHMMAYFEMLQRDKTRFLDAEKRMNFCPLGSAALAGTSFPIDRHSVAFELGFAGPMRNSIDGVSDRDFVMEFLSCASICAVHLSRFSEELVNWSSYGMSFVKISESMTSGSSIMPQKRNPDAAELVRAKTGRITGAMNALCMVMKGLPLAYSKDMQEDKEPLFDAAESLLLSIEVMIEMLSGLKVDKTAMNNMAAACHSTATDVADWLVRKFGVPFREAHEVVGRLVRTADKKGVELWKLSLSELRSVDIRFTEEVFSVMGVKESVLCRSSYGGTSPVRVMDAVKKARSELY